MGNVDLATLAELSLTLIGFSAILAIIQGGPITQWPVRTRNALWLVVTIALAALVLCLVPMTLRGFGVSVYPLSTTVLMLYTIVAFGISYKRSREYSAAGYAPPSKASWVLGGLLSLFIVISQSWSLLGFGNPEELYNVGVAVVIITAMVPLMVIIASGRSGDDV